MFFCPCKCLLFSTIISSVIEVALVLVLMTVSTALRATAPRNTLLASWRAPRMCTISCLTTRRDRLLCSARLCHWRNIHSIIIIGMHLAAKQHDEDLAAVVLKFVVDNVKSDRQMLRVCCYDGNVLVRMLTSPTEITIAQVHGCSFNIKSKLLRHVFSSHSLRAVFNTVRTIFSQGVSWQYWIVSNSFLCAKAADRLFKSLSAFEL